MTTDPDALTEAEQEVLSGFIGVNAYYAENCAHLFETVESILSARAAALRADIARDIRAAGFGIPQSNPGRTGYMRVVRVEDAAQIAPGCPNE